jgi:lysophospholipase L1-like esterase
MKTYILVICLFIQANFLFSQEKMPYETNFYIERMEYFRQNPLEQNQIIFLGNSLTQGGKWQEYFPNQRIANRGIVGDNTDGILARLGEIIAARPEKLFILSGANDVSQDLTNEYISENMRQIMRRVKESSPETTIFWQSVLPINNDFGRYQRMIGKEEQIKELNRIIREICEEEGIEFIYLYPLFLNENGQLDPQFTTDGLHLNEAGYEIWVEKIREFVE